MAQIAAFCWRLRVLRRLEALVALNARLVTRRTCAIVARGAVDGVYVETAGSKHGTCASLVGVLGMLDCDLGGEERLSLSPSGAREGLDCVWDCCCLDHASRVSASTKSMDFCAKSNAFRRSPVCAATFLEMSWMAELARNGVKSAGVDVQFDKSVRARADSTDAISGTV